MVEILRALQEAAAQVSGRGDESLSHDSENDNGNAIRKMYNKGSVETNQRSPRTEYRTKQGLLVEKMRHVCITDQGRA